MSIQLTAGEAIAKSPLNNSKSKYLYSFSKAVRFGDESKQKAGGELYNISTWRNNRSASFGYGGKYDFTKENKDKCQNFYNIAKDFDPTKNTGSPRYTFGMGRSHFEKVYYETNKSIDLNVPGPCKYDYLKPFAQDSLKFSISFRHENKDFGSKSKFPGPGEYKIVGINEKGVFPSSNFKNTASIKLSSGNDKRFDYSSTNSPGPSKYEIKPLIDGKGFHFDSKFKSSPSSTIVGRRPDPTSKYTCFKSKYKNHLFILISSRTWHI